MDVLCKANHIAVVDSFKEGNKGASTGKLSGMMNNQLLWSRC